MLVDPHPLVEHHAAQAADEHARVHGRAAGLEHALQVCVRPGPAGHLVGGQPQARVGDLAKCNGPPDTIVKGSKTVFVGGKMAEQIRVENPPSDAVDLEATFASFAEAAFAAGCVSDSALRSVATAFAAPIGAQLEPAPLAVVTVSSGSRRARRQETP